MPAALRAQFAVVGQHVAVELTRVIRDLDVERWLIPSRSAARIHGHLRRELDPGYQYEASGGRPAPGRRNKDAGQFSLTRVD